MNPNSNSNAPAAAEDSNGGSAVLAWLFVGLPLAWGVSQTFLKALALFK
ncbi:MFS transporter small subunit [Hymenobacter coccineus]|nr:oxalate:formate antiporter [Hymenobacter coccineus]